MKAMRSGWAALTIVGLSLTSAHADTRLQGAGATFPAPLYERWIAEYQTVKPDVKIDYQAIGSGGGIKGITDKTIDFAGSDAPMGKKEFAAAGGEDNFIEVPSCAGGIVPAYNVPGIDKDLNFTGELLADIYMGKINNWNDPEIAKLNPDAKLPNLAITPAWRTDGSGTNYVFTNYLGTQSKDFRSSVGIGKSVKWPVGAGGKGNAGVAQVVQGTPGALGYLEQNYADKNKIQYGAVQNKNGKFVKASPDSVAAAGESAVESMKGDVLAVNIWNQAGDDAYPIASFTYLIVYKDLNNLKTKEQAEALVAYLTWATHDAQKFDADLDYAPLKQGVQKKIDAALSHISFGGSPVASK
jgi:phosphate transport system substrate-binding protein